MPRRFTHEEAAARLLDLGYEALEEYAGGDRVWRAVHLKCGYEVTLKMNHVRGRGRPSCGCDAEIQALRVQHIIESRMANKAVVAAERMRAVGWEPLEPYPGSHERWRCRCVDCGDESRPRYHDIGKFKGCRTCSGRQLITPESARAVMIASGWMPTSDYPGPREAWLCRCINCGHEGAPTYEATKSNKSGCRMCSARSNGEKRRQRFEPQAVRAMLAMQLEPLEPYPGANKKWLSRCLRCNSLTRPTYGNVASGGRGCEVCRRLSQGVTKKSRFAEAAEARVRAAGYVPLVPYPGMVTPWKCLCRCGRPTRVSVSVLGEGLHGCRWCAEYGFSMSKPGYTYLLLHDEMGALKVGVASDTSSRVVNFQRHGWIVLGQERFATGFDAVYVEQNMLTWWREDLGLPPYLSEELMPLGGFTETVDMDAVPSHIAVARLNEVAKQARDAGAMALMLERERALLVGSLTGSNRRPSELIE